MKLGIVILLICFAAALATAEPLNEIPEKKEFQKILTQIGDESPRVLAAQYEALAAKSQQLSNLLSWTPSAKAVGIRSLAPGGFTESGVYRGDSASLQASINVFRFGGDVANVQSALKARRQADLSGELASIDAENKGAQLIFQWIEIQRRLESQRSLLNSKEELHKVAQNRFRMGQLPSQEVDKVQLDMSNARIQIQQAEVELLDLKAQLDGIIPGSSRLKVWPWLSAVQTPFKHARKKITGRLNYEKLSLETEIRGSRAWSSTTGLLPSLDLTASWQTAQVSPIGKGDWNTALVLTIPLWDQGSTFANRGYWAELQKAATQELEAFRREEDARLSTLNERTEQLRKTALLAVSSSEKAKSLAESSLRRFQLGRTSVNDLFLDQSRVFDAELLAQQSLRQYHLILLENCLAADERPSRCF